MEAYFDIDKHRVLIFEKDSKNKDKMHLSIYNERYTLDGFRSELYDSTLYSIENKLEEMLIPEESLMKSVKINEFDGIYTIIFNKEMKDKSVKRCIVSIDKKFKDIHICPLRTITSSI